MQKKYVEERGTINWGPLLGKIAKTPLTRSYEVLFTPLY